MSSASLPRRKSSLLDVVRKLHTIQVGGSRHGRPERIPAAKLADICRLLLMLLQNGLSLPKALDSLAADRGTRRYAAVLKTLGRVIEGGGTLSAGMDQFPRTFTPMQSQQVRMGERSGALEAALARVSLQLDRKVALRKRIIKKISYPILITVAGFGLMVFMCVVVVPEFENVYGDSGVDLPMVTRVVTGTSRLLLHRGWLAMPIGLAMLAGWMVARSRPRSARAIDALLLKLPILGSWFRDGAVLQFAEGISAMVSCGYTPVEAVEAAVPCVRNREVRAAAAEIASRVRRGERLSEQLARQEQLFGVTLCQLIAVGERSGDFSRAMNGTCDHLRERLEHRIDASVGAIEPVLTISLAAMIGGIVLSIYTPMFHMFEVLE